MSDAPPNQPLPQWVDARKFAYQGVSLGGWIALDKLPRLASAVLGGEDAVEAQLEFSLDHSRFKILSGAIRSSVSVTCQRCLEPMPLFIEASIAVAIVGSEDEAKRLPKQLEPWLVDSEDGVGDLYEVIEDELLLELPMVAYHDYQCIDKDLYTSGDASVEQQDSEKRENPFAILQELKHRSNDKR